MNPARLRRTYGLTPTQHATMSTRQSDRCAICNRKPSAAQASLAIDHDHITGLVCGLLCGRCNHDLLGFFGRNADFYRAVADYLTFPPAVDAIGHHYVPDSRGAEGDLDNADHG